MGNCCSGIRVHAGTAMVVWERNGKCRIEKGPTRVKISCYEDWEWLSHYSASDQEYLVIEYKDGRKEHRTGPCDIFLDPSLHQKIKVAKSHVLDGSELMVVYRQAEEGAQAARRLVRGPCFYTPSSQEWIHEFSWHGTNPNAPQKKSPNQLKFKKLRCIPDQMYVSVPEVRTSDDALLLLNFMVFFELVEVEKMLDHTHDPIADFINALTADAIAYASVLSYEMFLEKTDMLNSIDAYPQLMQRAKLIGYRVSKVVYRGYHASDKLQIMHDDSIQQRTQLRLEAETEEQAQRLADMKLAKDLERQAQKQEMQKSEIDHTNLLSHMQHNEKVNQEKEEKELELNAQKSLNAEQLSFMGQLKAMQVDLTQYLVAQYRNPDKLIEISSDNAAAVHVHSDTKRGLKK